MNNELNKIDEFYREALGSNASQASVYTWTRMRWRLLWLNYHRYILWIGAAAILSLVVYFGVDFNRSTNVVYSNTIIEIPVTSSETDIGTEAKQILPESTETENNLGILTEPKQEPKEIKENALIDATAPDPLTNQNNLNQTSVQPITTVYMVDDLQLDESMESDFVELTSMESIDLNSDLRLSENNEQLILPNDFETYKVPYDIDRKKYWISLGLSVSPAYTTSSLKADEGFQDYVQYREDHESPAISISAGLDIRFNIRKWYIQTGIGFSEFKQNRNYNNSFKALDSLSSYFMTDTIWGWVFDPPNIGEAVVLGYDTTFVPVYNQTNEGYNRWNYLEVPLIAGYKFKTGRFSIDVGTGFSCAFLLSVEGNVPNLTEENQFTNLSDLSDELNKYLYSYLLQVGASYHITPEWSLHLSPFYKQNLNSVFKNSYPVDQRFRSVGINFGLKVDL